MKHLDRTAAPCARDRWGTRRCAGFVVPQLAVLTTLTATVACRAPGGPPAYPVVHASAADRDPPVAVRGRHAVRIRAGWMDWSVDGDAAAGGLTTESGTNGFVGSVAYDYFVRQDLALGIATGLLDSRASTSVGVGGTASESAAVVPVLFGATYYPKGLAIRPDVRPWVSLSAGPYLGSATNSEVGSGVSSESISDTAFGLRVAAGVDGFLGRRVVLGIGLGYHFVSDFDERIGSADDYSGPELSIGLGLLLGGDS